MAIDDNTAYGLKGSQVKDLADKIKSKAESADGSGSSWVREASQIHTDTSQTQLSSFIFRTTAGEMSVSTGPASLNWIEGNTVQEGHTDESISISYAFAAAATEATVDLDTWKTQIATTGDYTFTRTSGNWTLSGNTVDLTDYGITVTGTVANNDTITVSYTALVVGTLTTATPTSFVATGFNQYDATAGYAHVVGGQEYRIDGTYTAVDFSETIGGTTTSITPVDDRFTPASDGYIYITGTGDILLALVWSGTMDSEPYTAYEASTITIPTADASSTALPTASYGMPSVGDVRDRLNFQEKTYTQKIGHYTYSAENLATVEALGVDYIYDLSDIYYVLETPIVYTLANTVSPAYIANDYGTEEFIGTTVALRAGLLYGNNLVDKLRNLADIQEVGSGLSLVGGTLSSSGVPQHRITENDLYKYGSYYYFNARDYLGDDFTGLAILDFRNLWNANRTFYMSTTGHITNNTYGLQVGYIPNISSVIIYVTPRNDSFPNYCRGILAYQPGHSTKFCFCSIHWAYGGATDRTPINDSIRFTTNDVGNLSTLKTVQKTDAVHAINELSDSVLPMSTTSFYTQWENA